MISCLCVCLCLRGVHTGAQFSTSALPDAPVKVVVTSPLPTSPPPATSPPPVAGVVVVIAGGGGAAAATADIAVASAVAAAPAQHARPTLFLNLSADDIGADANSENPTPRRRPASGRRSARGLVTPTGTDQSGHRRRRSAAKNAGTDDRLDSARSDGSRLDSSRLDSSRLDSSRTADSTQSGGTWSARYGTAMFSDSMAGMSQHFHHGLDHDDDDDDDEYDEDGEFDDDDDMYEQAISPQANTAVGTDGSRVQPHVPRLDENVNKIPALALRP
jgi:hypothetical protein